MNETGYADLRKTLVSLAGQQNVVVVYRAFYEFAGTLESALLFGQLLYWTPRSKNGWVAKTDAELVNELCLTQHGVRAARKRLQEMGVLETKVKRFKGSPTVHYKLDLDVSAREWNLWIQKNQLVETEDGSFEDKSSLIETTAETSTKGKDSPDEAEIAWESFRAMWKKLFPEKPQPKSSNKNLRGKIKSRVQEEQFCALWEVALKRAAESPSCQKESWFSPDFFLRNDQNYLKCYDRWMSWKDLEQYESKPLEGSAPKRNFTRERLIQAESASENQPVENSQ